MAELPPINLSPEATPWAKAMQQRVKDAESANEILRTSLASLQATVNSLIVPSDPVIADGSVTTIKLADNSVTTAKIVDGAVTDAKITSVAASKVTGLPSSTAADTVTSTAYNRSATGSGQFAMWMNSALQIMRNTSSRRFKENIVPYTFGERVLELEVVEYDRIEGGHEYGLIAEQVQEHVPEIVTWFAEPILDEDGQPTGETKRSRIDGVRYDLLALGLLDVVRDLRDRIDTLETKDMG